MKNNSSTAPRNNSENHPPLARDAQGNLLAVPDGTAGWSFKRETRGRPRLIVGTDHQPARFPLDTTIDDVEQMLGAGTFRVYAINDVGTMIDYVTTIVVGADQDDAEDGTSAPSSLALAANRGPGSDLRFALETLRDTSRALADSLKSVAASQADWVKGLAVAKQIPRNAPAWLAPPRYIDQDDGDEHDVNDDAEDAGVIDPQAAAAAVQASTLGAMAKIAEGFTTGVNTIKDLRNMFAPKKASSESPKADTPRHAASSVPPPPNPMIHLAEINARLTKEERRFLSTVLRGEDGPGVTQELLKCSVPEAVKLVRLVMRKEEEHAFSEGREGDTSSSVAKEATEEGAKDFMGHVMAASAFLAAEEKAAVLWLLPKLPADRVEQLKIQLLRMTPEDAAAWVKANLETLRAEVSS